MASVSESAGLSRTYRKRICVWAAVVAAIVMALSFQAAFPDYKVLPSMPGGLGAAMVLALFSAALCCEFIDSGLGMGYGTTLTPLLLLAGFAPMQIVPCVLLSEFATGLTAGIMHHRDGNVDFFGDKQARLTAFLLSILSAVGTIVAVTVALKVPKFWLQGIIAIIIISVGIATLATVRRRFQYRRGHIIILGTVAAFNKGLSGGGYGPLVTAGQVVSGLSPKYAVAITSLAESFTCLVGLIAYMIMMPGQIEWTLAGPLTLGAMLSVPMATLAVKRLPETLMRASVGMVTCLLGVLTVAKLIW